LISHDENQLRIEWNAECAHSCAFQSSSSCNRFKKMDALNADESLSSSLIKLNFIITHCSVHDDDESPSVFFALQNKS
jgi:hypothetical protein